MTISLILSIVQVVLKLIPELLGMKAAADARNEKLVIDEQALYEAAMRLLAKAQKQAASETEKAKQIDQEMDKEYWEHQKESGDNKKP